MVPVSPSNSSKMSMVGVGTGVCTGNLGGDVEVCTGNIGVCTGNLGVDVDVCAGNRGVDVAEDTSFTIGRNAPRVDFA